MAITPQHVTLTTKQVVHFIAKSLLYPAVPTTRFGKYARICPFSQSQSHISLLKLKTILLLKLKSIFTPPAQCERGKVIGVGVHIYIYIRECGSTLYIGLARMLHPPIQASG